MKTPHIDPAVQAQEDGFSIVFKGFEHMTLLAHAFPLPYPGSKGGLIHFYETINCHTFDFLAAVRGVPLEVRIDSGQTGKPVWHLSGVRITGSTAPVTWTSDAGPLVVSASMCWDRAAVRCVAPVGSMEVAQ